MIFQWVVGVCLKIWKNLLLEKQLAITDQHPAVSISYRTPQLHRNFIQRGTEIGSLLRFGSISRQIKYYASLLAPLNVKPIQLGCLCLPRLSKRSGLVRCILAEIPQSGPRLPRRYGISYWGWIPRSGPPVEDLSASGGFNRGGEIKECPPRRILNVG